MVNQTRCDRGANKTVAQRVVTESKGTSENTGALKRSMAFTSYVRVVTFRELIHGQFRDNSMLEKNAMDYRGACNGDNIYQVWRFRGGRTRQGRRHKAMR
jgi:hypothetical protein